jgi:hypothetical protein
MLPSALAHAMLPQLAPASPAGFKLSRLALLSPICKTLFNAATCPWRR